jgi:hypothetical protein
MGQSAADPILAHHYNVHALPLDHSSARSSRPLDRSLVHAPPFTLARLPTCWTVRRTQRQHDHHHAPCPPRTLADMATSPQAFVYAVSTHLQAL